MTTPAPPTLRDLCLDAIAVIAAELRKADPSLSRERSIVKAAETRQGREAHRLYQAPGSELPWPAAIKALTQTAELMKAPGSSRKVAQ